MRQRLLFLSLLMVMMGVRFEGFGQILTFEFSALAGNEVSANSNSNDANINSSIITRGAGLTASSNVGRFNATSWATTSIANAVSGNDYMEFTISPNLGYQFNVSSIVVQWQRSETGNTAISLRSSLDNYATDLDDVKIVTDNTNTQTFTWTFAQALSSISVTYRLYSYAEATGGSGGPGDGTGNDIIVNGGVYSTLSGPFIELIPIELNGFNYLISEGPSLDQTFSVIGINLTNNISITSPTNYEISKNSGSGYTSLLTYTPTEVLTPQTVYVRLKAGLNGGSYNGELVTATSTGAVTKNVTLNGRVKSIYTWNNNSGGIWTTPSNWNPARSTPAVDDRLVFNDGNTYTITGLITDAIEGVHISNTTKITLNSSSGGTLSIGNGSSGNDLIIEAGSELNISQTSSAAIIISVGTEASGSISGSMNFTSNTASINQLTGTSASAITFNSGAVFTQNTNSTGNVFGNTATGSVVFTNGSTFIQADGNNPFATNNVVVFQNGSFFKIISSSVSTSFSGRSYSNFEMDYAGTISASSTTALSFDDLKITQGTFNLNATGTSGHSIKGNITVQSGASLNFNPSSSGTVNFNGSSQQTISGGGTITSNGNSTLVVANVTGVIVDNNTSLSGNLTVSTGSLSINAGRQLTIGGILTNTPGTSGLFIKSGATGTGSLIHNSDNVAATAQRYIPGVSYSWHLTGSPVVAQSISGDWIPDGSGYDFYAYDEPSATWLNQKVGGNNITSFTPGKGYLTAYESILPTKIFSGNLNNGTVTVPVTKTGSGPYTGANLLANPYASGIDWSSATRTLFADNFAYVYDQTAGGGAGGYTTINGSAGNAWIAPHQGFFVIAQTAGDFSFIHAMREHGGTFTKNVAADQDLLSIRLSGETYFDVTSIRQKENTSSNRDRDDALKFYSFNAAAPQLYTLSQDGEKLMLNSYPELDNETAVNVGILIPVDGSYNISIESVGGLLTSEDIYLKDKLLGTNHNLTTSGAYIFIASPKDNPNRFLLHFGAVDIDEQTPSNRLKAYAINGRLYFHHNGEAVMEVIDLQGRLLESAVVNGQGLVTRQMNQPAGVYVVRLTGSEGVQTAKVVVK